jgi:CheY-like chemotaxis protein
MTAARPHKILVVEDNKPNQAVARQLLEKLGYLVELANNGVEALEMSADDDFDLVLMDVQMPRMDGYEATAELRSRERAAGSPHVPVIGLSARAMNGDRETALAVGMDDYLTKPLNFEQLKAALARWIRQDQPSRSS